MKRAIITNSRIIGRRFYAEAAVDELKLSFSVPHEGIYSQKLVTQVNIPASSGAMGVLANHVPCVEQLQPGVVEVLEKDGSKQSYFVSGGFAVVQPNSSISINAVEACKLEHISLDTVKQLKAEIQGKSDEVSKIEMEVLESIERAM